MNPSTTPLSDDEDSMELMYPEQDAAAWAETAADLQKQLGKAQLELQHLQAQKKKMVEKLRDAISCPVCFDAYRHPIIFIPCGHTFCQPCVYGTECPTCLTQRQPKLYANYSLKSIVSEVEDAIEEVE